MGCNTPVRRHLFGRSPLCHWCKRETAWESPTGKSSYSLLATVDHLVSRPEGRKWGEGCEKVLACYQCNAMRASASQKGKRIKRITIGRKGGVNYELEDDPQAAEKCRLHRERMERERSSEYRKHAERAHFLISVAGNKG